MRRTVALILAMAAGTAAADSPDVVFEDLLGAIYSGDSQGVHDLLSTDSVALLNMLLLMAKARSDSAAEEFSTGFGVSVTPDELESWSTIDLLDRLLSAPGFLGWVPPREDISLAGFDVKGDSCSIYLDILQMPGEYQVLMIREGGGWKVDKSAILAEL